LLYNAGIWKGKTVELKISNITIIRIVAIVLGAIIAVRLVGDLRTQLIWIFTALFLALALEPAVGKLARVMPGHSRGLAVLLVVLAALGVIVFVLIGLIPPFATQLYHLVTNLPEAYRQFSTVNPRLSHALSSTINSQTVTSAEQRISSQLFSFSGSAVGVLKSFFGGLVALITVGLLTFFMVLEGPRWLSLFFEHLPADSRKEAQGLAKQLHGTITGFAGGTLLKSLVAVVASAIMLFILGAPYTLSLSFLVGILDLVPLVGALLGAVSVCLVVLVFKGMTDAIIMAIFFLIFQQIENSVIQPLIFSKTVEVSPLVSLLALILGVSLAGFIGALVSIPAAASVQIVLRHWLSSRENNHDKPKVRTAS
jgi:predicted PurR-regulated permease PerM